MMNFRWNREIIETTDERIAIRFIGTNYTSVHNVTGLTGTINLTVNINTFKIILFFPKFYEQSTEIYSLLLRGVWP